MKHPILRSAGILGLLIVGACASAPEKPGSLVSAESRLQTLEADADAARFGGNDLRAAQSAIEQANRLFVEGESDDVVEHYITLADQRLTLAETRRDLGATKRAIDEAAAARSAMLLQARESEADRARLEARAAREELLQAQADAEDLASQVKELKMQESDRGLVLTLGDILFDFDSANLKAGGVRTIEKVASFLNEHQDRQVLVEGFTDAVGSDEYNRELSQRRADSVRMALLNAGVPSSRVNARGYGESYPIANNEAEAGRQQNRRVEVVIGDPGEQVEARAASR